jgi:electron transfer flavoprotein alpha subunit
MAGQVFAYILHKEGAADDTALELVTAAKKLDANTEPVALVLGAGDEAEKVANEAAASYKEVWKVDNPAFSYPNAETIRKALVNLIPKGSIVLVPHEHFGMDLSPGLSIKLDAAYAPDVVDFQAMADNEVTLIREEFTGQVSTHVTCDVSGGAVFTVRAGSFAPDESKSASGTVTDKSGEVGEIADAGRRFIEVLEAEVGDVDITKSEVLVSVGRGIEDQDNLEIIDELAQAMGADVSCSRPIVDAKWLEKSRQVGTSGQTVKPKVYMALGISGSFQHMGGVKGNPFIVAVNKNPKAPIFQVADVGVVADILEFVPELTEKMGEM